MMQKWFSLFSRIISVNSFFHLPPLTHVQQISPEVHKVLYVGFFSCITLVFAFDCTPSAVCKMRHQSILRFSLFKDEIRLL